MNYRNEKEVEVRLLHPLFRDTLGYPDSELDWGRSVPMQFGREKKTKEADLVAKYHGKPVITVEAKSPNEPVLAHLGQVDFGRVLISRRPTASSRTVISFCCAGITLSTAGSTSSTKPLTIFPATSGGNCKA